MLTENWEGYFSPAVLSRGYRYFTGGCVARVKPDKRGWQCSVDGSERYSVYIDRDFEKSSCDCPYFFDRGFCKHIAAACYEIESIALFGDKASEPRREKRKKPDPVELAGSLDEDTLRAYLIRILETDETWRSDFVKRFGEIDATGLRFDFLDGVRAVVREHSRRGFVDYRSAFQCEFALSSFVDEFMAPIVSRRRYDVVFDLAAQLALVLQKVAIDDSDGFFSSMLSLCAHYWALAFDAADTQLKQTIFDWMRNFIEDDDESEDDAGILWYIKETVEEFVCNRFAADPAFADQMLELAGRITVQELAEPATFLAANGRTVLHRSMHRLALWEEAKIRCMRTLGASSEDIDREIDACPPLLDIIQPLVDEARAAGDVNHAEGLLERYVERLGNEAFSTEAALQLLDIYGRTQQEDMQLVTLYGLAVHGRPQNDDQLRSWFRKLQKQAGDHWPGYADELEEALSGDRRRLHLFLAYTEQREKLAEALEEYGSRYEFERYWDLLAQEYPEKYLAAYEAEVRDALFGPAQQRNVYANAVLRMRRMQGIPGGDAAVNRIVGELRETYPRRRALMEELDRLASSNP